MNKEQRAHEYALKMLENLNPMQLDKPTRDGIAYECFELADAMQAEADKRLKAELPSLQQTFIDGVEQPRYAPSLDEWQPDWSQAPVWVNVWAMDENGIAHWYCGKYDLDQEFDCWMYDSCGLGDGTCKVAPHFNYTGNWQDSLRKRPHGE